MPPNSERADVSVAVPPALLSARRDKERRHPIERMRKQRAGGEGPRGLRLRYPRRGPMLSRPPAGETAHTRLLTKTG